jgi:hypothetical protein
VTKRFTSSTESPIVLHSSPSSRLFVSPLDWYWLDVQLTTPAVFFTPDVHLHNIEMLWTDGWINNVLWKKAMSKVQEEWKEFVVFSTILRKPAHCLTQRPCF